MSFIETIALDDAEGEVREMYERQQGAWGYVLNYAKSFSHRPEVMARWGRLLAELRRPMGDRMFEMVTFAAAHEMRHSSCSLAHGNALSPFFSSEEIRAIASQEGLEFLSEAEQAMLKFARQVARDAAAITAADVDNLKALGYDDGQVFDMAGAAAGRAFFTKVLDAVGSLPDAPLAHLNDALTADLTVGRAVDDQDVEVMN